MYLLMLIQLLPRPISESQTIPIRLKRRLGYKHHHQFQNIRPTKVLVAAQYLVHNSEIFKSEGIQVVDDYLSNTVNNKDEDEWPEFISDDIKETSQNLSNDLNIQIVENAETETPNDTIDNVQMMSGAKQLSNHLVLWILYYKNQILLEMVIEF